MDGDTAVTLAGRADVALVYSCTALLDMARPK
jgi:hypothetical protein